MRRNYIRLCKPEGHLDDCDVLNFELAADEPIVLEIFVDPDRLSIFAHVLREFTRRSDKTTCTFTFGSFDITSAGGALTIELERTVPHLQISLEALREDQKGESESIRLSGMVTPPELDGFIRDISKLTSMKSGEITLFIDNLSRQLQNQGDAAVPKACGRKT